MKRDTKAKRIIKTAAIVIGILALATVLIFLVMTAVRKNNSTKTATAGDAVAVDNKPKDTLEDDTFRQELIRQADLLAASYDYDGAIALLQEKKGFEAYQDIQAAIAGYENTKATLVEVDVTDIPHFFTHPLIYDAKLAFSSDMKQGYQQESLTVNEFNNFLQQMYDNDYVLVDIHDVAPSYKGKDGKKKVKAGKIYLPKGKKAFMFSYGCFCFVAYTATAVSEM